MLKNHLQRTGQQWSQLDERRATRALRYWEKAVQARTLAAASTFPKVKEQLLSVAVQYEVLAEQALLENYEPKRGDAPKRAC
jgi:hypothetical protein